MENKILEKTIELALEGVENSVLGMVSTSAGLLSTIDSIEEVVANSGVTGNRVTERLMILKTALLGLAENFSNAVNSVQETEEEYEDNSEEDDLVDEELKKLLDACDLLAEEQEARDSEEVCVYEIVNVLAQLVENGDMNKYRLKDKGYLDYLTSYIAVGCGIENVDFDAFKDLVRQAVDIYMERG